MSVEAFALQPANKGRRAPMGGLTGGQAYGIPMGSCYTDLLGSTTGGGGSV